MVRVRITSGEVFCSRISNLQKQECRRDVRIRKSAHQFKSLFLFSDPEHRAERVKDASLSKYSHTALCHCQTGGDKTTGYSCFLCNDKSFLSVSGRFLSKLVRP